MDFGSMFKPKMGRTVPAAATPAPPARTRNAPLPSHPTSASGEQVHVQREFYTMIATDDSYGEITLYGTIVQDRPMDYWTGEPVNGEFIILGEFLDDMKQLEGVNFLTIHLHSTGGDGYSSIVIHNKLREMEAYKTVIVDGVAMSGGSLIMSAADEVKVNLSSIVMIHKCWCLVWGYYNADEMRKMATANDAMDRAQAAIYKRRCSLSEDEILKMMGEETFMTGAEIVEMGFADEVVDGAMPNISASADRRTLFVDGHRMRLPATQFNLPDSIPSVDPAPSAVVTNKALPVQTGGNEGGNKPMANTTEELRKEYPDLTAQLEAEAKAATAPASDAINAAIVAERRRIQEIDEISASVSAEMLADAKFGEHPCTAQELALKVMKLQGQQGQEHLINSAADYLASGAAKVSAVPAPQQEFETKESTVAQAKADFARLRKGDTK